MFKFTKNSQVVRAWVNLIKAKERKLEEVPTFFGLREAVEEILKEEGGEK